MKLAKNFAAVTILVFTLALTSFAGDQQTPGVVILPPPPPERTATIRTEDSKIRTDVAEALGKAQETSDTFWYQVLLGLLSIY